MNRIQTLYSALRHLGPRIIGMRAGVYLRRALGTTRRQFRTRPWDSIRLEEICLSGTPVEPTSYATFKRGQSINFICPLGQPPQLPKCLLDIPTQRKPALAERLRLIGDDRCVYCFYTSSGTPIDWNANPLTGKSCNADHTWSDIPDFDPAQGDIRLLWDPARAAWAMDLARAHARGISPDAGPLFWHWLDSWMAACPPWQGPHWKCGQEAFVRLLAIAIGFWSLADDPATTPARYIQLAWLAWATGYRIHHHIKYAQSQKNNHALSEACGLMLVGHLFPEFRESEHWFQHGREVFCNELARQIYSDGSYVQHSHNYHRVMLQTAVLAARLAQWHGQPFDNITLQHIAAAENFLFQMLDPTVGQAPLYGNNDGAWVLPLNEGDYLDCRGAVQAAHFLATGRRRFPRGLWDEDLLWLFGPQALDAPLESDHQPQSTAFSTGGYFTLHGDNSWGMIRCHTYRDRPGQYDSLHFDLWHRGQNVLRDCGTYQYFPPEGCAMENYFQLVDSHNTIEVDAASPVNRVSRFLFFPWPRAKERWFEVHEPGHRYFEGESFDYNRRPWHILHRRAILGLDNDVWLIIDDLFGQGSHKITMRWHLADVPVQLDQSSNAATLQLASGDWSLSSLCSFGKSWDRLEIVRGREPPQAIQGFASTYYGQRIPIPVFEAEISTALPLRLFTIAAPGQPINMQSSVTAANGEAFELHAGNCAWRVELGPLDRRSKRTVAGVASLGQNSKPHADRAAPITPATVVSATEF